MPASYLLENGFLSFVYPAQYVAEPPLAHLYLALLWSLFGKKFVGSSFIYNCIFIGSDLASLSLV